MPNKFVFATLLMFPLLLMSQDKEGSSVLNNKAFMSTITDYLHQADSLFDIQDYSLSLPLYLKIDSLSIANNTKNTIQVISLLKRSEISKRTFNKESTNLAYDLAIRALSIAEDIDDQKGIHNSYTYLADLTQLKGDLDETKIYIDKALPYFLNQTGKDAKREASISRLYLLESAYYNGLKDLENAEKSRYKAIEYLKDKNNDIEMAKATYYHGHFLRYYMDDCIKAVDFLEQSRALYIKIKKTETALYHLCIRDLAICYDEFGAIEKSQEYYKEAYYLNVYLTKKANRDTSRRLETKYQTEKKEQEIELLTSQKQLAEQQKKSQINILLGGIILTGLAGVFLFMLYRNRKKTADKLKELDATKSKFFSNISHEFRTPLTLISSPIEDALADASLSEKKKTQFEMAKRNSDRLLSLVNQLLDLSKIDAGKLKLQIQKGNIKQLISAISDSFSYQAKKKHIHYSAIIDHEDALNTYFDKDALEKIVLNLLSNAIKYTPENGSVSFHSTIINNTWRFEVKNSGTGLNKEEAEHIFQRFYQTSEDNTGSGIGLALVKELVDLHKGQITVESIPNHWTTFALALPVGKKNFKREEFIASYKTNAIIEPLLNQQATNDDVEELINNEEPILLIVEDNADVRTLLKQNFEETYSIVTAPNGEKGIELALEHVPDIIISDIMMPLKDGIALTDELKNDARTSHIPIILLTAKAGDDNELKGIETGADDYITKPFNTRILRTKVQKLIESRQQLQKRYSQEIVLKPKDIAYSTLDEEFLNKVQTVLDDRLVEPTFSIQEFSESVGMSRMQLHRKIKALTGLSASDFIRSQRLKLAAELLKKSDVNVSDIGYTVGFNDHSYFTKRFKRIYKCTPTEYAKKFA